MNNNLLPLMMQVMSFISVFAGIAAGIIMLKINKKFGTGILASGFKTIALGITFITLGIVFDTVQSYFQIISDFEFNPILIVIKEILFLIGTYTIVIGSKKTGDKLESLTK